MLYCVFAVSVGNPARGVAVTSAQMAKAWGTSSTTNTARARAMAGFLFSTSEMTNNSVNGDAEKGWGKLDQNRVEAIIGESQHFPVTFYFSLFERGLSCIYHEFTSKTHPVVLNT